jgi:hypothetical protein
MIDIERLAKHLEAIAAEPDNPDDTQDFQSVLASPFPGYIASNLAVSTQRTAQHLISEGAGPMEALQAATEVSITRLFWLAYRTGRKIEAEESEAFAKMFGGDSFGLEAGLDQPAVGDTDDSDSEPQG